MTEEARIAVLETRMDKVESKQDDLDGIVKSIAVLSTKQAATDEDVKEIKTDVKSIGATLSEVQLKPAKKWDTMSEKVTLGIVTAIVSGLLGAFLALVIK